MCTPNTPAAELFCFESAVWLRDIVSEGLSGFGLCMVYDLDNSMMTGAIIVL